ncbi:hypothetical protein EBB07_02465 [Paenibacillaceae bacterium]|nr:hypothetical protein EBB07_02465 [Paenibacillaceae bacterium]
MSTEQPALLSQWDALLLEGLRAAGFSNEEILSAIRTGELPQDESEFHLDYQSLAVLYADQPELVERAVLKGYRIKYNTVGGLNSWIRLALNKSTEFSREEGNGGVTVSLTANERAHLESVLSYGWKIVPHGPELYRVVPVAQV